ncbi:hypothetical protein ABRZ81_22930 [Vibrio vulnificus]|uniref:hypothetical protein n=1 Tax=Vibrio vulnificus TaxID=672 RepID=UPI001A34495C|nr:hypothetical protein [Vibrio vulnificus]
MEQNISSYQSVFQLLAAIYLVAEWVSLERIGLHFQKKFRESFRYRLKINRNYSLVIREIYEEFEEKEWVFQSTRQINKNYERFKSLCWVFFVLSFGSLLISSFIPNYQIDIRVALAIILLLLIPFIWVVFALWRPAYRQYKFNVSSLEKVLKEVENAKADYKSINPEPTLNDAFKLQDSGDEFALINYTKSKRKYNEQLSKYMRSKFDEQ